LIVLDSRKAANLTKTAFKNNIQDRKKICFEQAYRTIALRPPS